MTSEPPVSPPSPTAQPVQAPSPPPPQSPPPQPFVVQLIPATPAPENTILNVVVGSLGVVGALVVLALMLGVAVAGFRVVWQKKHPATEDHLPPVV